MNTRFIFFLISFVQLLLLVSCGSGKPEIIKVDPAFREYVAGYTSGMVSREAGIRVQLEDTVIKAIRSVHRENDSLLLKGIFSFEPAVTGKVRWESENEIIFEPDHPLPVNQFYTVSFDLGRLAKVKSGFEAFRFQFATYHQDLFVETGDLYSYDDYNLDLRYFEGTIKTTDYEDTNLLKKTLEITYNGKKMPFQLREGYESHGYRFRVDSIYRTEHPGKLIISWDGTPIKALRQGKTTVTVPALGDFNVTSCHAEGEDDQYIELVFSEPVVPQQDLHGLIELEGVDQLTFSVNYNRVTVFLPNRIEGKKVLKVHRGVQNIRGHRMKNVFEQQLTFDPSKPRVRIKGNGSVLPSSKGLIFPFEAIGLKAVDVRVIRLYENNVHHFLQVNDLDGEDGLTRYGRIITEKKISLEYDKSKNLKQWNTHVLDLAKFIRADRGSIYRISIKFSKDDALCDCPVEESEREDESNYEEVDDDWSERLWDGYGFSEAYDWWYGYGDHYSPCNEQYYYGKAVSRNILASDLGVIYKLDEDHLSHAFVTDMLTAEPVSGAEVTYFDYTKQVIASGTTNAEGMLDIHLKRKPFLMVTRHGDQRGYLKLGNGYANATGEFDVDGEVIRDGVKGYIYGERGVWRPGDSLYLTFILQDLAHKLPDNHPVSFKFYDPNDQLIYETSRVRHVNRMYDFRTATSPDAPTGSYRAEVIVGNREFTRYLRVETVKPNRLKIYLDAEKAVHDTVNLSVKWLHGATAKLLQTTVSMKVNQMETTFPGYGSYVFDSPARSISTDMTLLYEGKLDEKGLARIPTRLDADKEAPGMLRAHYITRVFEPGGDFSIDRSSVTYSPFDTYVGLHIPKTQSYDGALETDKNYRFDLATLGADGKPVSAEKVQVKIYKLRWRWWYEHDNEDLVDYMAHNGTILVSDTTVQTSGGKGHFFFRVRYPDYGRYLVTATDLKGNHQTGRVIVIDYPAYSRANHSDNEHVNMLSFTTDKRSYVRGEQVNLTFPSPANGKALVSVETGKRVVKKFWVSTVKGETHCSFTATADMSPNVYIHVTLLQPHASTVNDLPIRMYGIVPITVDDPATHLEPEIIVSDQLRPETKATIRVKEKQGRSMSYTLAIVDEGLLDLTAFRTPQPWHTFYSKEALGVRTWDIYDYVIGAYAGKLDRLLGIGGDGSLDGSKGPKANRFKPVVTFLGPFEASAGQTRSHSVEIPNYVGSVRVMVVAHNNGAYGNAEKAVAVKKPLMVLATLPRVLGPGEQVQLPVNVFAMERHVKDVRVTVEVNDMLVPTGENQQHVSFSDIGDKVVNFKLNVAEKAGIARVKVTAISGKEKAIQEIELEVRPSNPVVYEGSENVLQPGKAWKQEIRFRGLPGTNRATVEFSVLPSLGLEKRLAYLVSYPHGCIEQTTSGAFPQLFLSNLMEMETKQQQQISAHIKSAIRRIQLFQTANGGFSYWPGEPEDNDWGTNYAGHFLVAAEQMGYELPANLKTRWIAFQQQKARDWSPSSGNGETAQLTQAYRLYVLAFARNPELGAMNRLREEPGLSAAARWRLAAAYQLTGRKEVAEKLVSGLPVSVSSYREFSGSYGSEFRDEAMILETLTLMQRREKAVSLVKAMAEKLSSKNWLSTQETAYGLLALCSYAGITTKNRAVVSYDLGKTVARGKKLESSLFQLHCGEEDIAGKAVFSCSNDGDVPLYAKLIVQGVPLQGDRTASASNLRMEITYRDLSGHKLRPEKLVQGTDFVAEVKIIHPGKKGYYREMALSQIFPSGWEIHNARTDGYSAGMARYQDYRDDRIYSYFDLAPNTEKTFTVHLNATYLGRFYLPTVYAEAMYDHLISASVPGSWVEVVRDL